VLDFGINDSQKRAIETTIHFDELYEYIEKKGIAFGGSMAEKLL
jgi:hypothetical protein